jgi:O-antigen ligase
MPVTQSIRQERNPMLRAGFPMLLVFLFAIFSAIFETLIIPARLHFQFMLAVLCLLALLASGRIRKVLLTPIGKCVALFTAWFILCIPFAVWPGGSFTVLIDNWYKSALIFFLTAGLLTTLPQANRVFHAIAYGTGFLGLVVLVKNTRTNDGRLILDNTRYMNPNDLAFTLLVGLTFIGFLFLRGNRAQKVIAVLMVLPVLLAMSRTGSRGAMLGVGVLVVIMMVQAKRATRLKLMVAVPIAFLGVLFLLPQDLRMRYTTYFGDYNYEKSFKDPTEHLRAEAVESARARKQLLIDSLVITMHHPLMGVGPGNFEIAQDTLARARGDAKGSWHVTHNTYTQISSEMGVTGLIIYLALLFNVFKILNSIIRTRYPGPTWQNLRLFARSLRATFIAVVPVIFFGAFAYLTDIPILAGLVTALGLLAQKQRAIDRAASAQIVAAEPLLETGVEPVPVGQY